MTEAGGSGRSVLVLRHGKSDRSTGAADHERPLRPRGRRAAKRLGRLLAEAGVVPDLVLTSTAARALATAELARRAGGFGCPLEQRRELYEASGDELFAQLAGLDAAVERVLLVAHQPGCSELVARLTGGPPPELATAALARVDLDLGRWDELAPGRGRLVWLIPPRALG
jgi:phosphohistidine phosphatase